MLRSSWIRILLALAVVVTPLVASIAFVPRVASAEPAAPEVVTDDEIILLESTGKIRVDDPNPISGGQQFSWNSGTDIGWTLVAAGDFDGNKDAEIAAVRGGTLRVFDPWPVSTVLYTYNLPSGRTFRLVTTGDFDGDGNDEIVTSHTDSQAGTGVVESVKVFDGGEDGTSWSITRDAAYGAPWVEMATGDVNNDQHDDLVLFRGYDYYNLIKIYSGANWSTLAQSNYTFNWLGVAVGNISSSYAGDEIALTRGEVLGQRDSVILFRLSGNTLVDLPADLVVNRKFYPYFRSIATGDLNGDQDEEVLLLRDPTANVVSLLSLNPNGSVMIPFEQAIGYGTSAWKLVRTGDTDADGLDEVVVLRGDRYRIYRNPQLNTDFSETLGSFLTSALPSNTSTMVVADVDGASVPTLGVSPASLTFNLEYGQTSPTQTLRIVDSGTSSVFAWQAEVVDGAAWLKIDKTSGVSPADLNVSVDTRAVIPDTYTGKIRITATTAGITNSPRDIPVTLNLTGLALRVTPSSLSFTQGYGDVPQIKFVNISSTSGSTAFDWQLDILEGASWLNLSALQGTTPSSLGVSVNAAAAGPGPHTATLRIRAVDPQVSGSPAFVAISLTVPDPGFVVAPVELSIQQKVGAPTVTKSVKIWRPGGTVSWTAAAFPAQSYAAVAEKIAAGEAVVTADGLYVGGSQVQALDWLVITPTSGSTTPDGFSTMTVNIKPGTPKGLYHAVIVVVASDANPAVTNPVVSISVTGVVADDFHKGYLPYLIK